MKTFWRAWHLWVGVMVTTDPFPWTGTGWDSPINFLVGLSAFYFAIEPRDE
mgnify:CR=1 FL=1